MNVEIKYGMSDEDYFAIDAVNASTLKSMVNPEKRQYRESHPVQSDALRIGTDFHALVLCNKEPADSENVAISPFDSFRTNESRSWKAEQIKAGKDILKAAEVESYTRDLYGMAEAVYLLGDFVTELNASSKECVILWDKTVGGTAIKCKAKLDLFNPRSDFVYDLKTCADLAKFDGDVFKYGYYISAAWYLEAAQETGADARRFRFAVAGKDKPYQSALRECDAMQLAQGKKEIVSLLDTYIECKDSDVWPSPYSQQSEFINAPYWWIKQCGLNNKIELEA